MEKFKKIGLFLGTLLLTLGLINFISAQFPTKAPYSAVSRDFQFMQDVQIDGALNVTGAITTAGGLTPGGDIVLADDEQILFGTGTDGSIDFDDDDGGIIIGTPVNGQKSIIIATQTAVAADFNFGGLVTTTTEPAIAFVDVDTDAWFKMGYLNDDEPFLESSSGDLLLNPDYNQNITMFEGVNANGENPTVTIFGYQTGTAARYGQLQVDTSGNLSITAESGTIDFGDEDLETTGTFGSGVITSTIGYLYNAEITASPSSSFTVNWTAKHVQRVTITGVNLDVTFTDPSTPCKLVLVVVQGDGDDTIDWTNEASILWPGGADPVLSTGNGDVDMVTFYFDGTNYLGVANYDFN